MPVCRAKIYAVTLLYHICKDSKPRESCLQNGIFIYKMGKSFTKGDCYLQNGNFEVQMGISDCNLPSRLF